MSRVQNTTTKQINLPQLASEMGGAALGGPDSSQWFTNNPKTIWADNVTQVTLDAAITAHVADPLWGWTQQQKNLQNVIATLRQWNTDAQTEANAWAGQTQAQRDAAMKTTFQRLGTFFDRFADLLQASGWGT